MQDIITLETSKYNIKIDNFEGPLDLLCHLIDSNKMDIYDVNINQITDQYIEYINEMNNLDMEVTSEFLVMASNLLYIKSKKLLPRQEENDEEMLTEEELIQRIIEYKQYKEFSKTLQAMFKNSQDIYYRNSEEKLELPKQNLSVNYDYKKLVEIYTKILKSNKDKVNNNAKNIEKIAVIEHYPVINTLKLMFKELIKNKKFNFNKLFPNSKCNNQEIVTAFSGLLEMSRRNKVSTNQEHLFDDIEVTKKEVKKDQVQKQ